MHSSSHNVVVVRSFEGDRPMSGVNQRLIAKTRGVRLHSTRFIMVETACMYTVKKWYRLLSLLLSIQYSRYRNRRMERSILTLSN